jgi:hypothetical protein
MKFCEEYGVNDLEARMKAPLEGIHVMDDARADGKPCLMAFHDNEWHVVVFESDEIIWSSSENAEKRK